MKVALSSSGKDSDSDLSEVFGRCPYFLIAETQDHPASELETLANTNEDRLGGAGVATAQLLVEKGVTAVVTGNIGPRALDVFRQFKIDVYKGQDPVKEVLQKFIDGKLEKLTAKQE